MKLPPIVVQALEFYANNSKDIIHCCKPMKAVLEDGSLAREALKALNESGLLGGRIEAGCFDAEAASAVIGMLASETIKDKKPEDAVKGIF